ncbi:hypothetical protein C6501_15260 [Candidatus Poribacteria bacterium]|nr:MAG: hypothetical protein C6501_15260 [Candidatus Poribacteria bacterium]
MKNVLLLSIIFCTIVLPAFADLTPQDLEKIRSIIKEENAPIKAEIESIKDDITTLKIDVAGMKGKLEGVDKQISHATNLTYGLIALIVVAVGIPQIIMVWRDRGESAQDRRIEELTREQNRRIEELTREIEALKQQRIVKP